ncbi:MAG: protein kinase [Polyangiales bacterium]
MSIPPAQPNKIGRYPVKRLLGTGAMGCVYLARDTELERDVAIKTVRLAPGDSREHEAFLTRFRNEARAVARMRHRGIVAVYDVGNEPEIGPYLVFEYVEGSNLKDIVRAKGPLTADQVVTLAEQVGDALDAAHREGIIHRDIKPENLLVGGDGLVRLADFGVARVPDAALTGEGQFLGTPCYGAPETLRGGEAGPLSDQFSLAAVLYESATGARAFPGSDAVAVAHQVIHDEPLAPSRAAALGTLVPASVDAVLLRGLSKQPGERFASIAALVAALRAAYAEAGALRGETDATVPGLLGSVRPQRRSSAPAPPERLKLWPFALALLVGFGAVVQLAPSAPASVDAASGGAKLPEPFGMPGASEEAGQVPASALPPDPAGAADATIATPEQGADAGLDAQVEAGIEVERLSTFEREERAKDALERAQRALSEGDREAARRALDEAFAYDPEHPDIAELRRQL